MKNSMSFGTGISTNLVDRYFAADCGVLDGAGGSRSAIPMRASSSVAGRTLTAHTLNSGIFEMGSCAEIVNWLALFLPGQ
jgi:hypothetical protein